MTVNGWYVQLSHQDVCWFVRTKRNIVMRCNTMARANKALTAIASEMSGADYDNDMFTDRVNNRLFMIGRRKANEARRKRSERE